MGKLRAWWNDDAKAISLTMSLKLDYAAVTLAWVWASWVVAFVAMFVYDEPDLFWIGIISSLMWPLVLLFALANAIDHSKNASWNDDWKSE